MLKRFILQIKIIPLVAVVLASLAFIPPPAPEPPTHSTVASPALLSPEPPTHPSPSASPLPVKKLVSIGDSLTFGKEGSVTDSYRQEESRLLRLTGQPHTWIVQAAPGSKCSYWLDKIDAIITTHQPDLIFLNCGTNDTPTDDTETVYRTLLSKILARNKLVVASLIGQPDMKSPTNSVRPYIKTWMRETNEALKRALATYPQVPYANLERIPDNPEWLQADGIHWTERSNAGVAQLLYQAAQRIMAGWKTFSQMKIVEMCGLNGVRDTEPWLRPNIDYLVCTT